MMKVRFLPVNGRIMRVFTLIVLLLTLSFSTAGMITGKAEVPIPSPILDPNAVSWASVRNMTSSQFGTYFDQKSKDGYMVIDIEVDEIDGQQRVGAVWQKNLDGRGWAEYRNLSASEFQTTLSDLRSKGYRLIDQEAYQLAGNWNYAGVWIENKETLDWISYLDQTSTDFGTLFDRYSGAGYLMIDMDAYTTIAGLRYSAVWVKNSENLDWVEWRDMTSAEFGAKFEELKGKYRMIDVESYTVNGTQYYAGIWVENKNLRGWAEWRDMSAKSFGNKWIELRDAGYRLINYEAYPTANGWRYAGVWRQNSSRPDWQLKAQVDALLEQAASQYDIPGMSVAIAQNGQFLYLRGLGYADVDDGVIAESRTIYRLASISKAVGGVISMRLVEQGKLDLDNSTRSYVPSLPVFHTHTVRQTVSNRSGIGHYEDYPSVNGHYNTALAAAQQIEDVPLVYTPGAGYKYSTHAYTFLGAAMEAATSQSIGTIVESQITTPFGLNSLRVEDRSIPNAKRATLYNTSNQEVSADDLSWKILGGGLESSAYDLARFGIRILNGTILTPASQTEMWTPPDGYSNYALGWSTGSEAGTQVVAKDGAQNGARSYLRMYPQKGIVIAILTNRKDGGHSPVQLGRDIGALMLASMNASALEDPNNNQLAAEEVEEPDEEGLDPDLVVWPVENPVAEPTTQDLQEPIGQPVNALEIFIPVVLK
jgi:CubicO group peptidase (beta-lactamase class C family)